MIKRPCPTCSGEAYLLFTNFVCDRCDPPEGSKTYDYYVVCPKLKVDTKWGFYKACDHMWGRRTLDEAIKLAKSSCWRDHKLFIFGLNESDLEEYHALVWQPVFPIKCYPIIWDSEE